MVFDLLYVIPLNYQKNTFNLQTLVDNETGEPKDELQQETINWLANLDVKYTKLSEILAAGPCPKVNNVFNLRKK